MSTRIKWAVLLCSCQGGSQPQANLQFFVSFFTPGLGGATDYWRDVTRSELDLGESAVFGWYQLPVTSQQMQMNVFRSAAIQMGIDAATRANRHIAEFGPKLVFISEQCIAEAGTAR